MLQRFFLAVVTCLLVTLLAGVGASRALVMPWMCLERCGYNSTAIKEQVGTLIQHGDVVTAVSFEWADLGPNGTVILNNFTNVAPRLQAAGLTTVAMITTVDLDRMRVAFADPFLFASRVAVAIAANGAIDGVNIDFEPNDAATDADAAAFADFLFKLRFELAWMHKTVSADVASWNRVWNFTAISESMRAAASFDLPPGRVMTMDTYALSLKDFNAGLDTAVATIDRDVLVVGLLRWSKNLTRPEVQLRFNAIAKRGITRVAIWETPLPAFWWDVISDFVNGR